jgi:oligopeptide/dipeptide ABC transporter ATP-binding protein
VSATLAAIDAGLTYPRAVAPALHGIDLEIHPGQALGVVGESGSGKTTLGRLLVGVLSPTQGRVLVKDREWATVKRRDPVRREVQMVFQDPYGALNPWMSAKQAVAEVFQVWQSASRREAGERADEVLEEVGVPPDARARRPSQLSGGQCQRVGIARALAADPSVLIADEPTSSLDVSVQAQILNLLSSLRQSRGLAIVLISHDLSVVSHVTDETLVLFGGRLVERGPTDAVLSAPAHPYTRVLLDSVPGVDGDFRFAATSISTGCVFAPRCPLAQEDCGVAQPDRRPIGESEVACIHPLAPQPTHQLKPQSLASENPNAGSEADAS